MYKIIDGSRMVNIEQCFLCLCKNIKKISIDTSIFKDFYCNNCVRKSLNYCIYCDIALHNINTDNYNIYKWIFKGFHHCNIPIKNKYININVL